MRDATLDRIALDQARAMAAKDNLSHEVLGPFTRRVAPAGAGRARREHRLRLRQFRKALHRQWSTLPGTARTCCCAMSSRVGIASARDASGKRTYWAMVIAGDYEPKRPKGKGKKDTEPVVAAKRESRFLRPCQIQRVPHQAARPLHLRRVRAGTRAAIAKAARRRPVIIDMAAAIAPWERRMSRHS